MRPAVIVVAGIGVVFAGVTGLLMNSMMAPPPPTAISEAPAVPPKPRTVQVLVAASALEVGRTLTSENWEWQEWPEGSVRREQGIALALSESERAEIIRQYEGAVLRTAMVRGEPFVEDKVIRPGGGSLLALVLTPGMRSVTVPITAVTGSGGMIQPGDRVDVLLTMDIPDGAAAQTVQTAQDNVVTQNASPRMLANVASRSALLSLQRPRLMTETILTNVRVIARDRNLNPNTAVDAPVPANVTFEVTPQQAEILVTANRMGQLSLVMRPLRVGPDPERVGIPVTTDVQVTPALQASRRNIPVSQLPVDENPFNPNIPPLPEEPVREEAPRPVVQRPVEGMGVITIFRGVNQQVLPTVNGRVVGNPGAVQAPAGGGAPAAIPGGIQGLVPVPPQPPSGGSGTAGR
jgi:pilus assembly protein CpaB